MSWIQKLYETYNACQGNSSIRDSDKLCPVGYSIQNSHIEIVIDGNGNFRRASLVQKENNPKTLIPVTESSAGRTSGEEPHPLCDSLQYCAGDYAQFGGKRKSYFDSYFKQLRSWAESEFSHPKVVAICSYVSKMTVIKDLFEHGLLAVVDGVLIVESKDVVRAESYPIMKLLTADLNGDKDQAKVFIRWSVESPGTVCTHTWEDKTLFESWRNYLDSFESKIGFCYVTGERTGLSQKHPAKLRSGKDGAKLISSNDNSGYTFLGRFTRAEEVAGVSSEVTQKAHSALRWLIGRNQAFRNGDQVIVTWAIKGHDIPDLWSNSLNLFGNIDNSTELASNAIGDVGQSFASRLNRYIAGYKSRISDADNIVVIGLDSATPGRMAITYYRELTGSEFLRRIERWHLDFAWHQNYGQHLYFVGAPAPRDITWAAYCAKLGSTMADVDKKLLTATVERILPCIVDGTQVPTDLTRSAVHRASNRNGLDSWEWEKCLGIACSLYKGTNKEREYKMDLEEERKSRDYLYGRLLAVAEQVEFMALFYAKEKRETTAARLMQRFADRPYSTWRTIETALVPYMTRIHSRTPSLLKGYKELLDEIHSMFISSECFTDDKRLTGEYLLGYHCQRKWLRERKREDGKWVLREPDDSGIPVSEIEE